MSKKFIALFLVVSLMTISCATLGMRRQERFELPQKGRGAKVIITKIDGQEVRGELIAVKPNSLLLSGFPEPVVSVGIADIRAVRIVKKSKASLGACIGGAIIIGGVALAAISTRGEDDDGPGVMIGLAAGLIALPAAALGGLIGAFAGIDKVIYFTGMTDSEIKKALKKLSKKARIRDYR